MPSKQDESSELRSAWTPSPEFIASTNIAWLMRKAGVESYPALHAWSVQNREAYWSLAIERLGIRLSRGYSKLVDLSAGVEAPQWLPGARMNIVESCFAADPDSPAIIHQHEGGKLETMSLRELADLSGRVAANIRRLGFEPGAALAILMPMTAEAVAIYLGIVKAGCAVVGIADSFQPREIASRLKLSNAAAVFTQDVMLRGGKALPLYAKVVEASSPIAIVLPAGTAVQASLRPGDLTWAEFLSAKAKGDTVQRDPSDPVNILFSSGTTGEPKVIPWTHITPIKCAADSHFHQNVQPGDVLVWPTNLGWMMGPWLIFASLVNRATIGLYSGAPTGREFGEFVRDTKATMLGVVPSLVKTWRHSGCMQGMDWGCLRLFSSTGECSNAGDMEWLMQQAGGKPVIEYCGGTEIGGAYITGTVTMPCVPGTFSTPTLGLDVMIMDDEGHPSEAGELFLVPPSIGLSNTLLNKDHHEVYFANAPRGPHGKVLRRHGDQMERLPSGLNGLNGLNGLWRALGRADDTMNLGGIKVSSAEIEQALQSVPGIVETAAIAVSPEGGPSLLVIYAVPAKGQPLEKELLAGRMQAGIKQNLNPLFKIHDVVLVDSLPRTASNKVMRRELRTRYLSKS